MDDELHRKTLAGIQALLREEFGQTLAGAGEKRLSSLLSSSWDEAARKTGTENFLSRDVTILLADLRGFSAVSERYPVDVMLDVLNDYFSHMSRIVFDHGGTIDKFMGDAIMVLFGAPESRADDVERAVRCAVTMQVDMSEMNKLHRMAGRPELFMGIGINSGTVMAGNLGSDLYSEYTVIGEEVNLTSRIETFSLRGQVLISESTFARCKDLVRCGEPEEVHVKGKTVPVVLHEVLGIPGLGLEVPRQEIRRSPRVEVHMPFSYQLVDANKSIQPDIHHGYLLDVGYHGVLAEVDNDIPLHSDIKLDMDLSLIAYKATDVYAKVLKVIPQEKGFKVGIEFTAASVQTDLNIHQFIQLLIQGVEVH